MWDIPYTLPKSFRYVIFYLLRPLNLTLFLPDLVTWRSYMGWFRPWPVRIGLSGRLLFKHSRSVPYVCNAFVGSSSIKLMWGGAHGGKARIDFRVEICWVFAYFAIYLFSHFYKENRDNSCLILQFICWNWT